MTEDEAEMLWDRAMDARYSAFCIMDDERKRWWGLGAILPPRRAAVEKANRLRAWARDAEQRVFDRSLV